MGAKLHSSGSLSNRFHILFRLLVNTRREQWPGYGREREVVGGSDSDIRWSRIKRIKSRNMTMMISVIMTKEGDKTIGVGSARRSEPPTSLSQVSVL